MVISEKSEELANDQARDWEGHTLGIHKVGDGDRVAALDLGHVLVEHDLGTAGRADAHVLLAELLNVGLDG